MRSLSIVNEKGGVGKTTILINVAFYLQRHGWKIAVIDADEQGNVTEVMEQQSDVKAEEFFAGPAPKIEPAAEGITVFPSTRNLLAVDTLHAGTNLAKNFRQRLQLLDKAGYDVCLIDLPGKFSPRFHALLLNVNYVIAPILLDKFSIAGVGDMLQHIMKASKGNPDIKFLGLLPNEFEAQQKDKAALLEILRSKYAKLLLPFVLTKRQSIRQAAQEGTPLWQDKRTAARAAHKEMRQVADFIIARIDADSK